MQNLSLAKLTFQQVKLKAKLLEIEKQISKLKEMKAWVIGKNNIGIARDQPANMFKEKEFEESEQEKESEFYVEFLDGMAFRVAALNSICAATIGSNIRLELGGKTRRELRVRLVKKIDKNKIANNLEEASLIIKLNSVGLTLNGLLEKYPNVIQRVEKKE